MVSPLKGSISSTAPSPPASSDLRTISARSSPDLRRISARSPPPAPEPRPRPAAGPYRAAWAAPAGPARFLERAGGCAGEGMPGSMKVVLGAVSTGPRYGPYSSLRARDSGPIRDFGPEIRARGNEVRARSPGRRLVSRTARAARPWSRAANGQTFGIENGHCLGPGPDGSSSQEGWP